MILSKVRFALGAGILCAALTAGTVGSALAAPPDPTVTQPAATTTTTPATSPQTAAHPRIRGLAYLLHGFFKPVAALFGITPADLRSQLESGQTLAQIAANYGKSATDVENTLMNELKTRLDKLVSGGKLSSSRETTILNNASSRIDDLTNRNLAPGLKRLDAWRAAHPNARLGQRPASQ
jgi:hypothetical protein